MRSRTGKLSIGIIALALLSVLPLGAQAQAGNATSGDSVFSNAMFNVMLAFIVLLLLVIIAMAEMVKAGSAKKRSENQKKNQNERITGLLLLFLLPAAMLNAQTPVAGETSVFIPAPPFDYWGMSPTVFFVMAGIILFELLIATMLFRSGMLLIKPDVQKIKVAKQKQPSLLEKLNDSVAVEQESAIMMDHDYDGIRELDNNLPPWWKYGFYLSIVVSVIYLFHYHVFHTGKLSGEEYSQEMKDGAISIAEYQKSAVNLVDENTVKYLSDPASLNEGSVIYKQNCVACHGESGEGKDGLGPNFTDDYWLHGGSINSVFRSVKYGWTDKGMKSWQQDLKPSEIQLVVSFIKSIRGTNPPNAKEKQGELYIEEGEKVSVDSTKTKPDSVQHSVTIDSVKNK
ncbi:hypothetical protein BH11BAC7_BH11BAC7_22880 [soil metagenome]